jgi:hypothetical protein
VSQPTEIIAMTWYRSEDWDQLLAIFEDAHRLPASHAQWLQRADAQCRQYENSGTVVEKVNIDPKTFSVWCRQRSIKIDAEARTRYANEFVAGKYLYGSSN